ncbi:MAG TPA: hypothetical protein DIS79_02565 [Bacteroidetes bacterium]|nr:hypothetical protein [Bacteroidota bacterium]
MYSPGLHQRSTYKLIDSLLSHDFRRPLDLLISLVHDIVESSNFEMTGGRVWELDVETDTYVLRHQEGEMEFLDMGTRRHVDDFPAMVELATKRTLVTRVDDERGSRGYSLTGVGDLVKRGARPLYPFAIAFTTHDYSEEFAETMIVVGSAATTALRNLHARQREHRLNKDLDQAWELQRGLVPDHSTTFGDYDIYGVSLPESVVGGDYFDYLHPSDDDNDRLGLVVSDAASKGLPAAVQALFVSGALRMAISFQTRITSLIQRLNWLIYDTFPNERFVSLCYCELTTSANGLVLYANAGHCPPIHYIAATGDTELLLPTGGILGIIEEQHFGVENINMRPGDLLVLYTDGITEAQDRAGKLYGEERLKEIISRHHDESPGDLVRRVLDDVQKFSTGGAYSDDKTIIVVRRRPAAH